MKDLGTPTLLLGIETLCREGAVRLRQKGLIDKLFKESQIKSFKPVKMPKSDDYGSQSDGDGAQLTDDEKSRSLKVAGSLIYIALKTGPDLCIAASVLSTQI